MKKIVLVFFVTMFILNAYSQGDKSAQSYVYVYRGGQWGAALSNYKIFIDGKKICKLSNDKYFKFPLSPGKHDIEAKVGGASLMKKETFISIETIAGHDNYISCNVKRSITRSRLEMTEVVESNGKRDIDKMKEDKCDDND